MPFFRNDEAPNPTYGARIEEPEDPTLGERAGAAFRGTTVGATITALPRIAGAGELDPSFDPYSLDDEDVQRHPAAFVDARNAADFQNIKKQIAREDRDNEVRALAPVSTTGLDLLFGVFDPVNLIPVAGQAKGAIEAGRTLERVARGAAIGVQGAAIQEGVLRTTQKTRTNTDSLYAMGAGALLGGALGGAAGLVGRRGGVEAIVRDAAARHGVDPDTALLVARIETGGTLNPRAQNPASSAGGLFQFIDSTWAQYGGGDKLDARTSADAGARYLADVTASLRKSLGRDPEPWEIYLGHQQGAGGAAKLLANPSAKAADLVGADAVRLNGGRPDMTAGEFAALWRDKAAKFGGGVNGAVGDLSERVARDIYEGVDDGLAPSASAAAIRGASMEDLRLVAEPAARLATKVPFFSTPDLEMRVSASREARIVGQELTESHLYTRGNIEGKPSAVSVESAVRPWEGAKLRADIFAHEQYVAYRKAMGQGWAKRQLSGRLTGVMTEGEFHEAVGQAAIRGDSADDLQIATEAKPFVTAVAKNDRLTVLDPLRDEAMKPGAGGKQLLTEAAIEAARKTAKSYLTRIYNRDKINANIREFRGLISEKLRGLRDADEASAQTARSTKATAEQQLAGVVKLVEEAAPDTMPFIREGKGQNDRVKARSYLRDLEGLAESAAPNKLTDADKQRIKALGNTIRVARDASPTVLQELQDMLLRAKGELPSLVDQSPRAVAGRAVAALEDVVDRMREAAKAAKDAADPLKDPDAAEKGLAAKAAKMQATVARLEKDLKAAQRTVDAIGKRQRQFASTGSENAPEGFSDMLKVMRSGRGAPKAPERFSSWVRKQGGVKDVGGDIAKITDKGGGRGIINNKSGIELDNLAERALEDGWWFGEDVPTQRDIIQMIEDDIRGGDGVIRPGDADKAIEFNQFNEFVDAVDATGINLRKATDDQVFEALGGPKALRVEPKRVDEIRRAETKAGQLAAKLSDALERISGDMAVVEDELAKVRRARSENSAAGREVMAKQAADLAENADRLDALLRDVKTGAKASGKQLGAAERTLGGESFAGMEDAELDGIANQIVDNVTGNSTGRTGVDIVQTERGPMKERLLTFIRDEELEPWLVKDRREVLNSYVRTMAPDVELFKRYGSVNGQDAVDRVAADYDRLIKAAKTDKEATKLRAEQARMIETTQGLIARLRHNFWQPRGSGDIAMANAASVAKSYQVMVKLHNIVLSSFADTMRPIFVHGIMRTFGDGIIPMVRNLKLIEMTRDVAREAATASDLAGMSLMLARSDMEREFGKRSPVQAAMEYGAGQMFRWSGFDHFNQFNQVFSAVITQSRMIKAIEKMAAGGDPGKLEVARLAKLGIGEVEAQRIGAMLQQHGSEYKGARFADPRTWEDDAARRLYLGALGQEIDEVVIKPGQDKPFWLSRPVGSVIGQFKGFSIASMQRTMLVGIQRAAMRDMAVLSGSIAMVAAGMLGYAVKAKMGGWELSDDPAEWVWNGVEQSGLIAYVGDFNRSLEAATRGGAGVRALLGYPPRGKFDAASPVGAIAGPTFGSLEDVGRVISGIAAGDLTAADVHRARRLIPFQAAIESRWLFDMLEDGTNDALGLPPKRR